MIEEIWLPLVGYEIYYEVSNLGRIRSFDREVNTKNNSTQIRQGKVLKQYLTHNGYLRVVVTKGNKRKSNPVHRLIANTFIPNPENKPEINHKDGYKTNNVITNLEWVTRKENMIHAVNTGLVIAPKAVRKLTPEIIKHAKELREEGRSYKNIGLIYGVSKQTMNRAINNKTYNI